jgi:hypothetical protein
MGAKRARGVGLAWSPKRPRPRPSLTTTPLWLQKARGKRLDASRRSPLQRSLATSSESATARHASSAISRKRTFGRSRMRTVLRQSKFRGNSTPSSQEPSVSPPPPCERRTTDSDGRSSTSSGSARSSGCATTRALRSTVPSPNRPTLASTASHVRLRRDCRSRSGGPRA